MPPAQTDFLADIDPEAFRWPDPRTGSDPLGQAVGVSVMPERMLSVIKDGAPVAQVASLGDHPTCLAVGTLVLVGRLPVDARVVGVDLDEAAAAVTVRTDVGEGRETAPAGPVRASWLLSLAGALERAPGLHRDTGALVLAALSAGPRPLLLMQDLSWQPALAKLAGWQRMHQPEMSDGIVCVTGHLTADLVSAASHMGLSCIASRWGATDAAVDLARERGLVLVCGLRGRRFHCLAGADRLIFDSEAAGRGEASRHQMRERDQLDD